MYLRYFRSLLQIKNRYICNQAGDLFLPLLLPPFACISISIWSVSILMYLEITLVMSALISSIISGEQFTRSDIRRIFKRSFATWQELFLRKKCFIFILPFLCFSKNTGYFRPKRYSLFEIQKGNLSSPQSFDHIKISFSCGGIGSH